MAPLLVSKTEIDAVVSALPVETLIESMAEAYKGLSAGRAFIAPISHIHIEPQGASEGGHACVKGGYVRGDEVWVVKVASGFSANEAQFGISNSQGVMLCFSQRTGELLAVLADDGHLTDVRTAVAAAMCATKFGPAAPSVVAIYGTGVVGRLVAKYLGAALSCDGARPSSVKLVMVSRSTDRAGECCADLRAQFSGPSSPWAAIQGATYDAPPLEADIIVTCTPSKTAIVYEVKKGALVIALGADGPKKRELGARMLENVDLVLCDSIAQCTVCGEMQHEIVPPLFEIGAYLLGDPSRIERAGECRTVVVDLTGVATQDVAIAMIAYEHATKGGTRLETPLAPS